MQEGLYVCLLIGVCGGNSVKSEKKKVIVIRKLVIFPLTHSTKEDDLSTFPCFNDGQNDMFSLKMIYFLLGKRRNEDEQRRPLQITASLCKW